MYDVENKNNIRNKNEEKLDNNISRAKSKIYEYALCNDFEYFVTLTLDSKKMDRSNINEYIKKLGQYIRDIKKSTGQKIEYILIPERHADGENWHMHGLMKNLQDLRKYEESENIPKRMKDKIIKYREENLYLYEWVGYSRRFGFNCIEPIRNKDACSRYITKYISKNLVNDMGITEKNKKKYYCSRGLKTSRNIKKGVIPIQNIIYDYENEHCKIKWLDENQANDIGQLFI
ncbi:MAG TPA: replication endonuclease [Gallicola sp.]|nr:replication endonuclease [Gallicola sp.]